MSADGRNRKDLPSKTSVNFASNMNTRPRAHKGYKERSFNYRSLNYNVKLGKTQSSR